MYFRDRFKTFGTVSSVEVIRRTDEKGMYMYMCTCIGITELLDSACCLNSAISFAVNSLIVIIVYTFVHLPNNGPLGREYSHVS